MNLSRNLLILRKKKSLTQAQVGDKIGVSKQQIGYYEAGQNTPSQDKTAVTEIKLNTNTTRSKYPSKR